MAMIPREVAAAQPRACPYCHELIHDPFDGNHLGCSPTGRHSPPPPTVYPVARSERPGAAVLGEVQTLLKQLGAEASHLASQAPDAVLESEHDHRIRSSAIRRLESLAVNLRECVRETQVATR